jgi:hypothetical protein
VKPPVVDGELVDGLRWCASCGRYHGGSFLCASYSPEIATAVLTYEPPLPSGAPGCGVGELLAPFTRGAGGHR